MNLITYTPYLKCREFQQDCPTGKLEKPKVQEMYSMILPEGNAAVLVDHIFRIFDKNANGSIDFKVRGECTLFIKYFNFC